MKYLADHAVIDKAAICFMCIVGTYCMIAAGADFPRASYVSWKEERTNVLSAKQEFEIKILFADPCAVIKKYFVLPEAWRKANEHDPTYYSYKHCSEKFQKDIIDQMNALVEKYNVRLHKRAIPLLGIVGGIWASNILDSIYNENDDIAQREEAQNAMLESLAKRQNYTTEAIVAYAQQQKFLLDKVNQLYTETNQFARNMIRLQFALEHVSTHMSAKKDAIESIRFLLINSKRLDLKALNKLLDTKVFENIDTDTLEFVSINRMGKQGYVIRFYGHTINEEMRVYNVRALAHWINVTSSPATLIQYAGPSRVLVNKKQNCVLGLADLRSESLSQACDTTNGRSLDLDMWIPIRTGNPFNDLAATTYSEELPYTIVYCLGRSIKIDNEMDMDCPPYAFAVPATSRWKTNDREFPGFSKKSLLFNVHNELPDNIFPDDFQVPNNTKFVEIDALKQIYNLTQMLKEEQLKSFALNTPVGGVSHSMMVKILLSSIGTMIVIMVWFWRKHHATIIKHHRNLMEHITINMDKTPVAPAYPELESDEDSAMPERAPQSSFRSLSGVFGLPRRV